MNAFFTELLNMSLVASLLIIAVVILRLVFKKAPKAIICVLWALVGLRLICPFSFESRLSLVPDSQPVTYIAQRAQNSEAPENVKIETENVVSYEVSDISSVVTLKDNVQTDYTDIIMSALPYVWAVGAVFMALSSVISYIRIRRSILVSLQKEANIYRCDGIKSPFILGVLRPKIYIPSHLSEEEQGVVISHEKAHLKRLDHIWKPLGFIILIVHWFNPLVWLAYALLCRDIESACDEYVIKKMSCADKKLYSETLLSCSSPRHMLTACPVAFGEISVKSRVKSVLSYKKPALWIIVTAVAVVSVVAVLFMTNPVEKETEVFKTPEELIHQVIMEEEKSLHPMYPEKDSFPCESHYVFDVEELGNKKAYYLWVAYMEYILEDGQLQEGDGGVGPRVITMEKTEDGNLKLKEYWTPADGEGYGDSIRGKFPSHLHDRVLHGTTQDCVLTETEKLAAEHFGIESETQDPGQYPRFTGRILDVGDEHYLIAPTEGEIIMGQSIDKVYVYHGGEDYFIEGELVTVSYNEYIEESYPPILGSINSISLMIENFRPVEPENVEFYYEISAYGEDRVYEKTYAKVDVTKNELKGIEIYRFSPEALRSEESLVLPEGKVIYHESFSPYIYINNFTETASFAYSDGCYITGHFSKTEDALTIAYYDYYSYINDLGRSKLVFDITDDGYVLSEEKSDLSERYIFEIDGKFCDKLPEDAVFKDNYGLEVK